MKKLLLIVAASSMLTACYTPATSYQPAPGDSNFTLGTAQKKLYKGMEQSDVVTALGAPNLVTMDKDGVETWVYDRSSREVITTQNAVGAWFLIAAGETRQASGKSSQRTLTLILKFKKGVLTELAYNSSSF